MAVGIYSCDKHVPLSLTKIPYRVSARKPMLEDQFHVILETFTLFSFYGKMLTTIKKKCKVITNVSLGVWLYIGVPP